VDALEFLLVQRAAVADQHEEQLAELLRVVKDQLLSRVIVLIQVLDELTARQERKNLLHHVRDQEQAVVLAAALILVGQNVSVVGLAELGQDVHQVICVLLDEQLPRVLAIVLAQLQLLQSGVQHVDRSKQQPITVLRVVHQLADALDEGLVREDQHEVRLVDVHLVDLVLE